jgi:hypothetical protein
MNIIFAASTSDLRPCAKGVRWIGVPAHMRQRLRRVYDDSRLNHVPCTVAVVDVIDDCVIVCKITAMRHNNVAVKVEALRAIRPQKVNSFKKTFKDGENIGVSRFMDAPVPKGVVSRRKKTIGKTPPSDLRAFISTSSSEDDDVSPDEESEFSDRETDSDSSSSASSSYDGESGGSDAGDEMTPRNSPIFASPMCNEEERTPFPTVAVTEDGSQFYSLVPSPNGKSLVLRPCLSTGPNIYWWYEEVTGSRCFSFFAMFIVFVCFLYEVAYYSEKNHFEYMNQFVSNVTDTIETYYM